MNMKIPGKSIRSRIYGVVILIMIFFSVTAWIIFSISADWYVSFMSARQADRIISIVEESEKKIRGYYAPDGPSTKRAEKDFSRDVLKEVRENIKNSDGSGRLIIFSSEGEQIYPNAQTGTDIPEDVAAACRDLVEEVEKTNNIYISESSGERWYLCVYKLGVGASVRAEFFVAAVPMMDAGILKNYSAVLMAAAAAVFALTAAAAVWLWAKSISDPIADFCVRVRRTAENEGESIKENYELRELEQLKDSYNRMIRELKNTEEEKNRIFQNVSHDLRTPLALITGYAQGINRGMVEDKKKAAGTILKESMRMNDLVESILTLTKMDNGELKLNIEKIDLEGFLEEKAEALELLAGNIKLSVVCSENGIIIDTDPELLTRIIQNLVTNALRYAESSVVISVEREEGSIVIKVSDDGSGFGSEELAHAFERFYQGSRGRFGIGLSVVRQAAEYLGGQAEIANRIEEGRVTGAVCSVTLPVSFCGNINDYKKYK